MQAKKKFWAFKALGNNEGELTIYGEIADFTRRQDSIVTEFDEDLWIAVIDKVTVYADDDIL